MTGTASPPSFRWEAGGGWARPRPAWTWASARLLPMGLPQVGCRYRTSPGLSRSRLPPQELPAASPHPWALRGGARALRAEGGRLHGLSPGGRPRGDPFGDGVLPALGPVQTPQLRGFPNGLGNAGAGVAWAWPGSRGIRCVCFLSLLIPSDAPSFCFGRESGARGLLFGADSAWTHTAGPQCPRCRLRVSLSASPSCLGAHRPGALCSGLRAQVRACRGPGIAGLPGPEGPGSAEAEAGAAGASWLFSARLVLGLRCWRATGKEGVISTKWGALPSA